MPADRHLTNRAYDTRDLPGNAPFVLSARVTRAEREHLQDVAEQLGNPRGVSAAVREVIERDIHRQEEADVPQTAPYSQGRIGGLEFRSVPELQHLEVTLVSTEVKRVPVDEQGRIGGEKGFAGVTAGYAIVEDDHEMEWNLDLQSAEQLLEHLAAEVSALRAAAGTDA